MIISTVRLRPATVLELAAEIGHPLPADDADGAGPLVRRGGRLGIAGALPGDLRPHGRGDADRGQPAPGGPGVRRGPGRRRRRVRRGALGSGAAPRRRPQPGPRRSRRCGTGWPRAWRRAAGRGQHDRGPAAGHLDAALWNRPRRSPSWPSTYRDQGVAGFDIAGAEAGFPPDPVPARLRLPAAQNAVYTIHAGEAFGLPRSGRRCSSAARTGSATACGSSTTSPAATDGEPDARSAGQLRPRPAGPAGDVPDLQRADRCRGLDRRAPDRDAATSCGFRSRSTATTS